MPPQAEPQAVQRRRRAGSGSPSAVPSLLLADSDETVSADVSAALAKEGTFVLECRDGAAALLLAGLHRPPLVLLGAPLPVVDAATVTRVLAQHTVTSVLIGMGPQQADEAVHALSEGALALVTRPYRLTELLPLLHPSGGAARLTVGDIELDPVGLHASVRGRPLRLPLREFELLRYLMQRPNQVVSRGQALRELWGTEPASTNTLTVHIKRLRTKLSSVPGSCCTIDTIRGLGYRLECPDAAAIPPRRTGG